MTNLGASMQVRKVDPIRTFSFVFNILQKIIGPFDVAGLAATGRPRLGSVGPGLGLRLTPYLWENVAHCVI
jgi:hypothetical protein